MKPNRLSSMPVPCSRRVWTARIHHTWRAVWLTGLLAGASAWAADPPSAAPEYQLKAVYLYHLANFVIWPDTAFSGDDDPFYICILGTDPFRVYLDTTIDNETAKNREIRLSRLTGMDIGKKCHILFISNSEAGRVKQHLNAAAGQTLLTVADMKGFVEHGGMVQFYNERNKVRLKICPQRLKTASLEADANLLRIAKIFCPE